jgi:hypothetical protein
MITYGSVTISLHDGCVWATDILYKYIHTGNNLLFIICCWTIFNKQTKTANLACYKNTISRGKALITQTATRGHIHTWKATIVCAYINKLRYLLYIRNCQVHHRATWPTGLRQQKLEHPLAEGWSLRTLEGCRWEDRRSHSNCSSNSRD